MEEIDVVEKDRNYGCNIIEGTLPYRGSNENVTGIVPPIWEYGRDQGNATIGGFVYRGPELKTDFKITSFGVDEENDFYICADYGRIYRIIE